MSAGRRRMGSAYMEWAKRHAAAHFDLATSGVSSVALAELPVRLEDLELTGTAGYGYAPLRERLAAHCGVAPDCVVTAAGTSMANHLAIAALVEPGDEVLIERPTYELLVSVARYLGARVRRFPRRFADGWRLEPEAVERALGPRTRLVVVTNLHNPSSVRTPPATLDRLAGMLRRRRVRLLVDEVYLEAAFERPLPTAFHLGPGVVTTASLTKAYGLSGLRCGWVLAAPALARRLWRLDDLHAASAAHCAERLSVVALDDLEAIASRARHLLDANRALVDRFLDSRGDLEVVRPPVGTTVFPRLGAERVETLCRRLRERYATSVVPGRFFGHRAGFRLGFGGATATVEEGLARLGLALDELG